MDDIVGETPENYNSLLWSQEISIHICYKKLGPNANGHSESKFLNMVATKFYPRVASDARYGTILMDRCDHGPVGPHCGELISDIRDDPRPITVTS